MMPMVAQRWESMRTEETRQVEDVLRKAGFDQVDSYRFNVASIRVRVVDRRFEGRTPEERDAMVEPHLRRLPEGTEADITSLFTFAPADLEQPPRSLREYLSNVEFEDPSPSML